MSKFETRDRREILVIFLYLYWANVPSQACQKSFPHIGLAKTRDKKIPVLSVHLGYSLTGLDSTKKENIAYGLSVLMFEKQEYLHRELLLL